MKRRVVITGLGAITPLGLNVQQLWQGLLEGRSGGCKISRFDTTDYSTKIAAEVKGFDGRNYFERKELRHLDVSQQYALAASQEAVKDSGFNSDGFDSERAGAIIGSGIGGIETFAHQYEILLNRGPSRISPYFIPMMISDMAAGLISMKYNLHGANYATVSACASSAHALGNAFRLIQNGEADIMMTGGTEAAIIPIAVAGFCSAKALTTNNEEPEKASKPFDKNRDGFLIGEGAGILIIEELQYAKKRGAKIYAEIVGYGMSADAYHITAPDPTGRGAVLSMRAALDDAGISPKEVDYINAHGTATPLGDISETSAIKKVFGDYAYKLTINSTKSVIGHLLGASGAVESLVVALSIRDDKIHPTINYQTPDPKCDLDYSPNKVTEKEINIALTNAFGFGGHNATIVLEKYRE